MRRRWYKHEIFDNHLAEGIGYENKDNGNDIKQAMLSRFLKVQIRIQSPMISTWHLSSQVGLTNMFVESIFQQIDRPILR